MKIEEIMMSDICNHIREIEENLDENDKEMLKIMQKAAISYCTGYTGLTEDELNEHEDVTIVVLTLISDMWDNRSMTVKDANENKIVTGILGMHCINFLPVGNEV